MAKGIIVVESIPESCLSCKRSGYKYGIPACKEKERQLGTFSSKPDWCPIRPMPEKMDVREETVSIGGVFLQGRETGWNECIDEILSSKERS